uniref:Uncharacterized protein n=1 Tax=Brassica campestris TaxID=3711 RepID=M4EXE9_BRACM
MSLGQKGSGDPGAMLTSLLNKREKLRQDLRSIEKQAEELGVGREDGRAELGPGRSKGGLSTGQGKPKKGRGHGVARDAKRNRPSEPDYDDEDDPDASMYVPGSLI